MNWVEITYGFPNILFLIKSIILGQLTLFFIQFQIHINQIFNFKPKEGQMRLELL